MSTHRNRRCINFFCENFYDSVFSKPKSVKKATLFKNWHTNRHVVFFLTHEWGGAILAGLKFFWVGGGGAREIRQKAARAKKICPYVPGRTLGCMRGRYMSVHTCVYSPQASRFMGISSLSIEALSSSCI